MTKQTMPSWISNFDVVTTEDTQNTGAKGEFEKLLSETGQTSFKEGEVYKGKVVGVTDDLIMVDIGYKQEGLVFTKEFRNYDGTLKIGMGDEIEVFLDRLESKLGNLVLSYDKAEILKAWDNISEACEKGEPVTGTVVAKVKGGLSVDIGVKAFLPGSQVDIRPVKNLDRFIGKRMDFKVIKFNNKRGNIVLSRRAILQEERGKLRSETLGQIQEEMIVKGIVKNITDYGAFIDLGGVDGLLHITDMSWGRIKHPSDVLNVADEIEVKILKYDAEKERVSLGLKQVQANPWDGVHEKFSAGTKVSGEVVSVKDYGVFVELDSGIEGLIHVSEMSWSQKLKDPSKIVTVGESVEAVVLEVDIENKRISLGMKQLQANPWEELVEAFNIGQTVKGKINSIVDFGMFVDVNKGIDALIHVSDLSWTRKNINITKEYKVGEEIEASVLAIDPENQRFCLGLKQLEENPWKRIEERYPIGKVIDTEVVRITDFGAFAEVETGIEGLIHISELSEARVEKPDDVVKKGQKVKAMVLLVDKEAKKIALSIKAVGNAADREMLNQVGSEEIKSATLADKFKDFKIGE